MLYSLLKNLIINNYFSTDDMKNKLNIFVLYNQITEVQYAELMSLIAPPISITSTDNSTTSPSS